MISPLGSAVLGKVMTHVVTEFQDAMQRLSRSICVGRDNIRIAIQNLVSYKKVSSIPNQVPSMAQFTADRDRAQNDVLVLLIKDGEAYFDKHFSENPNVEHNLSVEEISKLFADTE